MLQQGRQPGLPDEHVHEVLVRGKMRENSLDCDPPPKAVLAHIVGQVQLRHPTGGDF